MKIIMALSLSMIVFNSGIAIKIYGFWIFHTLQMALAEKLQHNEELIFLIWSACLP